jgi:hypothetical protein
MAITAEKRNEVISLLVGMFDAAPSAELMTEFVGYIENGTALQDLAESLSQTAEFKSLYPVWLTNAEFARNFATNLLDGNTSPAILAEAIDFMTAQLNGGATRGEAAHAGVTALAAVSVEDAQWGQAAQALQNKTDVATYFATTKLNADSDFASLRAVVANVDATAASVSNQKILIDANLDSAIQYLTTGQDFLKGSAGNDAFVGWIFDNSNTAQSGDFIDGGAGFDTLSAEIGNSQKFAISLKTNSVERAEFRAQAESPINGDNDIHGDSTDSIDKGVQIDAGDMNGTIEFWNTDSRANLTIEDVQAQSHTVTLGMRNTDSGSVNYEVYFDNISAPGASTQGSQLFLELLDLDGMRTDGEPLKDNPYVGVSFKLGDETITLGAADPVQTSYTDLAAGLNALLQEQGYSNLSVSLGNNFSAINSKNGQSYQGTTLVLTNSGSEVLSGLGWVVNGLLPPDSNVHTQITNEPPATTTQLTQTDVVFDYVGSGSKGGSFVAGEISQAGGVSSSGTPGIQQFNIDVDRKSWLQEVRSTNDTLREVNVENIGAGGSLRIDYLNAVKVFNASAMTGDVTVNADLSNTALLQEKYLAPVSGDSAGFTVDNQNFTYLGGAGNDRFVIDLSLAAAAYEDTTLLVDTGAGNDYVKLVLSGDSANQLANQQGMDNLTISTGAGNDTIWTAGQGDVTILAGAGNDTVYNENTGSNTEAEALAATGLTLGAAPTDPQIAAAAYFGVTYEVDEVTGFVTSINTDNANLNARWVVGADAAGLELTDLLGAGAAPGFLYGGKLTVSFSSALGLSNVNTADAFSAEVDVPHTNGVVTQYDINQAIKKAINTDDVLSKLLVANDGPGNNGALVITSLIDGEFTAADLVYTVTAQTSAQLGTQAAQALAAYQKFMQDSAATAGDMDTAAGLTATAFTVAPVLGQVNGADVTGADSLVDSDNTVNLGAGDDVLVLSTATGALSEETIVFEGTSIGNNTIVNFEDALDVLDFTSYLTNAISASGSTVSQQRVATSVDADGAAAINLAANNITIVNDFGGVGTQTWAALDAAALDTALEGTTGYSNIGAATIAAVPANMVGAAQKNIVMIGNDTNAGEYKVFEVTSDATAAAGSQHSVSLLGTVDFGSDLAATVVVA